MVCGPLAIKTTFQQVTALWETDLCNQPDSKPSVFDDVVLHSLLLINLQLILAPDCHNGVADIKL
jgi:hypothetical protein